MTKIDTKIEKAIEALVPLAKIDIAHLEDRPDDWPLWGSNATLLCVGDVRRARVALIFLHAPGG